MPTLSSSTALPHGSKSAAPEAAQQQADIGKHTEQQLAALGASRNGAISSTPHNEERALQRRLQLEAGGGVYARVEGFLRRVFGENAPALTVLRPEKSLSLDKPGMARMLSIPEDGSDFTNAWVTSKRLRGNQGDVHNPWQDRRKTDGTFHITGYGQATPFDKKETPPHVAAALLERALHPGSDVTTVPYTRDWKKPLQGFATLYLRPTVVPKVPGVTERKSMEILVAAPGNFVSNLDFLERVFGHGGDPGALLQDAALDPAHWTGHTGMILFAPQLVGVTKKELGLPHLRDLQPDTNPEHARLVKDRMFWVEPTDKYNEGEPFKLTTRGPEGVIVDIIADNYYGYGKKTVKAHLSYAANLNGKVEEEHAGGAIAYSRYDLGENFIAKNGQPDLGINRVRRESGGDYSFESASKLLGMAFEVKPEGYAVHKDYPIVLLPDNFRISLNDRTISWGEGQQTKIPLVPQTEYFLPSGYRVTFEKGAASGQWRLVGTSPEGVFCHKPFTVSGGGKSEIAKALVSLISVKPLVVENYKTDVQRVEALLNYDFSTRFRDPSKIDNRPLLSPDRSLGSVVKLLTPSAEFTDDYNRFLSEMPSQVREFVQFVKRVHTPELGERWKELFGVDVINGQERRTLQFREQPVTIKCLRVGFFEDGKPRLFTLRDDFISSHKLPREDDITASIIVKGRRYAEDVELFHFQRPDGAKNHEDPATDAKFGGRQGLFISNYEPQGGQHLQALLNDPLAYEKFTPQMQRFLRELRDAGIEKGEFVTANRARVLPDGSVSTNPRFLEVRPDLEDPGSELIADIANKLHGHHPFSREIAVPVDSILMGRRLNKPTPGIPSLAVYNPIHYQELPELFMDLIPSITGKGPSTIGFGKERALTKGPFNAMPGIVDLNNSFVGMVVSGGQVFSTAAGFVGPRFEVEHDVSMLIPELWSRMSRSERDANYLIKEGLLEPVPDLTHEGEVLPGRRLGYRVTEKFSRLIGGRIFEMPDAVFPEQWLKPEKQDPKVFADGLKAILKAQREGAEEYFKDGTIEQAVPPLKALLHIMRDGYYDTVIGGDKVRLTETDPRFREMFTKEAVLASDWYQARINAQHAYDVKRAQAAVQPLESLMLANDYGKAPVAARNVIEMRAAEANRTLEGAYSSAAREALNGGIGLDPAASLGRA